MNKLLSGGLLLLFLSLTACHSHTEVEQDPVQIVGADRLKVLAEAINNLNFSKAELVDFPDTLPLMGKISATEDRTNVVPARAGGRIESIMVASGETVTAGQPLATVFSPDFVAAREEFLQSV